MLFAYMATFCQNDFFLSVILFKIWHEISEKNVKFSEKLTYRGGEASYLKF